MINAQDPHAIKHRSRFASALSLMGWILICGLGAILLFVVFTGALKLTVVSGKSMEPNYHQGDVVVSVKQSKYNIGDVIVYQPNEFAGRCDGCHIVHRVIEFDKNGQLRTEGDNNDFVDQWWLTSDEILGAEVAHIPLGDNAKYLFSPRLWLFVLSLLFLCFVISVVLTWWKNLAKIGAEHHILGLDKISDETIALNTISETKRKKRWSIVTDVTASILVLAIVIISIVGASATNLNITTLSPLQVLNKAWTFTPPAPPKNEPVTRGIAGDYTVTVTYTQTSPQQICANIRVHTTSIPKISWTASLRTQGVPFNGDTNASHYQFNNQNFQFQSQTAVSGVFTIVGVGNYAKIDRNADHVFSVCNYGTGPAAPVNDPNVTYTVSPNGANYTVTPDWYVCQTFTVTSSGATQFYVGWNTTVDVTPLYNAFRAKSGTTGSAKMPSGDFAASSLGGNLYKVWGTGWATSGIKDGSPQSFQMCWG